MYLVLKKKIQIGYCDNQYGTKEQFNVKIKKYKSQFCLFSN